MSGSGGSSTAGVGSGDSGDVNLLSAPSTAGRTGSLLFSSGAGLLNTGSMVLGTGDSIAGVAGSISLRAGSTSIAAAGGSVEISGGVSPLIGGNVRISSGGEPVAQSGLARSGAVSILSATAGANSGAVSIATGDSLSTGGATITTGNGRTTGGVTLSTGSSTAQSGPFRIRTGDGNGTAAAAGSISIAVGETRNASSITIAGSVDISSGSHSTGSGGGVSILTGKGKLNSGKLLLSSGTSEGDSGDTILTSGDVSGTGSVGIVRISSGTSARGSAGLVQVAAGDGDFQGGNVQVLGGNTLTGAGIGGSLTLSAGSALDNDDIGFGGSTKIASGDASIGTGGDLTIVSGQGSLASGDVSLSSSSHSQTGGGSGDVNIYSGNANIGDDTTQTKSGDVQILSGDGSNGAGSGFIKIAAGSSSKGDGSFASLSAGRASGFDSYNPPTFNLPPDTSNTSVGYFGGDLILTAGDAYQGSSGGSVSITGGTSDGAFNPTNDGTLGGDVVVQSGMGGGKSGQVILKSGDATQNPGSTGDILISSGDATTLYNSFRGKSGKVTISSGFSSEVVAGNLGESTVGLIEVIGGQGVGDDNVHGGDVLIAGGIGANSGRGGTLSLFGGSTTDGNAGGVIIQGGQLSSSGLGGSVTIRSGHSPSLASSGNVDIGINSGTVLMVTESGSIETGQRATNLDFVLSGKMEIHSALAGEILGNGLRLESTSATAPLYISTSQSPISGTSSTAPVVISTGAISASASGVAGTVLIGAGSGGSGGKGGSIVLKPGDATVPSTSPSQNDRSRAGSVQIQNEVGKVLLQGNALGGLQLGGSESGTGVRRLAFEMSNIATITDTGILDISGKFDATGYTLYRVQATAASGPGGTVTASLRFTDVQFGYFLTILIEPGSNSDLVIQQQFMTTGSSKVLRKGTSSMFIVYTCPSGNGKCLSPLS